MSYHMGTIEDLRIANGRLTATLAREAKLREACKVLLKSIDRSVVPCDPANPEDCGLCFAEQAVAESEAAR